MYTLVSSQCYFSSIIPFHMICKSTGQTACRPHSLVYIYFIKLRYLLLRLLRLKSYYGHISYHINITTTFNILGK